MSNIQKMAATILSFYSYAGLEYTNIKYTKDDACKRFVTVTNSQITYSPVIFMWFNCITPKVCMLLQLPGLISLGVTAYREQKN